MSTSSRVNVKKPQWTLTAEVITQETSDQDSSNNSVPLSQEDPQNPPRDATPQLETSDWRTKDS